MYALPMIAGVLSFSIILFAGLVTERHLSHVRVALAALLSAFVGMKLFDRQTAVQGEDGFATLLVHFALPEGLWDKIFTILIPLLFMVVVLILKKKIPRTINAFADIVLGALGTFFLFIVTSIPISQTICAILALAVGLLMMMWHIIDSQRYLAITTSVVGGAMVSYLFSRFYYLPLWFSIALALLLIALGLAIQLSGLYKRRRKDRVFKGEEIA